MRKRLRYAMVGGAIGSFIGPIHRMALRMDDTAELVAGCFSRNDKKNRASAERFGIEPARVYSNWRELIAKESGKIDFLVICTTNETHYEIAKTALKSDIDVFCEKPLSLTVKEAGELRKIASTRHLILGIPFTYTGYPMVKLARDMVKKGELGRIDKVVMEYVQGSFRKVNFSKPLDAHNAWKMNPKIAGPSCVVADIGVHAFTMIEYVTGLEVKTLLSDLSSFAPGNVLDDDASILMRLEGGAKASLVTSKIATGEENGVRMRIYGEKAALYWNQESPNYLQVKYPAKPDMIFKRKAPYIEDISASSVRASRFPAGHPEGFVEALANIYDEFVASVVSRKSRDFPGAVAGERSMRFVAATIKSAKAGSKWTKL